MVTTQKALLITEIGKPLEVTTTYPIPQPGDNQVQLKVSVAGINPHDQKARGFGLFVKDNLPAITTNDVVGIVTKLGNGVTEYAVGDRIVSHADFSGKYLENGLQEYAIADVGASAKIPDSVSDDEAATLPTNTIAPLVGIFDALKIPAPWAPESKGFDYANTALLIMGGGSSTGKFGVQLAKLAGIGKIVVVGGPVEELTSYGATNVLDRFGGDEAVLERIRAVVGDDLIYAFDPINPPPGQVLALNALSSHKRGAVARLLPLGPVDTSKVIGKEAGFDVFDVFGSSQMKPQLTGPYWKNLPTYLLEGKIKTLPFVTKDGLTAENVNGVLDDYRDGKKVVKTHIHV